MIKRVSVYDAEKRGVRNESEMCKKARLRKRFDAV